MTMYHKQLVLIKVFPPQIKGHACYSQGNQFHNRIESLAWRNKNGYQAEKTRYGKDVSIIQDWQ